MYVRHNPDCKRKNSTKCGCPFWLYIRRLRKRVALRTNSEAEAQRLAREYGDRFDPQKQRVAELGMQRELRCMLEHALQNIASLKAVEVTFVPAYEAGEGCRHRAGRAVSERYHHEL